MIAPICPPSDMDRDGDLDLVFSLSNEPAAIVANETGLTNDWLVLRLIGTVSNRDCIGARAILHTTSRDYLRLLSGGGSYLSQGEYLMYWGIPAGADVLGVTVFWPSGLEQKVDTINGPGDYTLFEPAGDGPWRDADDARTGRGSAVRRPVPSRS